MKRPLEDEYDSYVSYSIALNKYCDKLDAEITSLEVTIEKLRTDAAWYQWLRNTSDTNILMVINTETRRLYFGNDLDSAIEAAIKESKS